MVFTFFLRDMQYRYSTQICNEDMQHRYAIQICNTDMQHRYAIHRKQAFRFELRWSLPGLIWVTISWGALEPSWDVLGTSWGALGALWGALGLIWEVLEA